jgi:uncharacterized protein (DUF427 family)
MSRPQRIAPGPGQESVWDYPRPPRIEETARLVRVLFNGVTIAQTRRAKRVLETSSPPVFYIPREDIQMDALTPTTHTTLCEWKGRARYYTVTIGDRRAENAAWTYPDPTPAFAAIHHHLAFYAGKMDSCYVDEERVQAQPGDFYGGWVTREIVGPFKGGPGSMGW